ncbi:hypothetical protein TH61_08555 [Rufibacter sp. DG15C]|uniref:DUF3883 domain-containing protein n=1 Tax=Rufibacter sp. DG15C TaxID=1379909 RepID=UPI00078E23F2|nr:DUF3883 domain-containing protein [Rufibacter sp. DG15C]AMM51216.1 hypothetical protein TH61_08555 [Rufibacter sp. DG15C]
MITKKNIIEELFQKRSDFKDPDQAETMSNLLDTVSSDIYSESQRFVFELIQNADDAAKDTNNEVHFEFYNDCLIVSHNGHSFTQDDIKALTSAGSSTKKADNSKTGYKGIGFKSVFGKSGRVSIFSDGFQFRFDKEKFTAILPWQIIPIWTEVTELPPTIQESIARNKYSVSTIIEIKNAELLQKDLNELLSSGQILLFLRRVAKISVSKNEKPIYTIEKKIIHEIDNYKEVTLTRDGKLISSWITKTFGDIPVPEKTKKELKQDEKTPKKLKDAEFTEISFAAKVDENKIKALKEGESLIFTYLPTKVDDFKFPFLVNGSFLTNAAREGIHEDKIWNQWLFELIAEKILDWLELLATSKYKFQILHLLPYKFNNQQNELKKSFDISFAEKCHSKKFIITGKENIRNPSEVVLDKTGLSIQKFIDPKSIIEFLKTEKKLTFSDDCFVNSQVEEPNKLKAVGVESFELDNFETFFISKSFTSKHKVSENFSLIKYFKEKSESDKQGIWFQTLKTLPFIYDEEGLLYNPSNGICFPVGLNSTELGEIPVIHPDVFEKIQIEKPVFDWLKNIGVKEPSQVAYVTNVIIPNIGKDDFINTTNFLKVTHYLFRLFKENLLDEEMLECLRELKIKTKDFDLGFEEAQFCYLSNKYQPQLKIEGVIKDVALVSEEYLSLGSSELEWNLFFKAIKVKDRVEVETINQNNSLDTLKQITDVVWVDECQLNAKKSNGFGFGDHNVISSLKLPSFLNLVSSNFEYSKLFWKSIISNPKNLADLIENARYKYGVGNGHNSYTAPVQNYFPWFIKNRKSIPASTKEILVTGDVFINSKEIKDIAGNYLPVFELDEPLPNEWKDFLQLKNKLELDDYLSILSKIAKHSEEIEEKDSKFKPPLRRIGLIYNKLAALIPDITSEAKQIISNWAVENKLLSIGGTFEPANQLKWITIEGFSTESDRLKVIHLPDNCDKKSNSFIELMTLFKTQTIDEFIPRFDNPFFDSSLKNKLGDILPFYVALIEKKKYEDSNSEFDRVYQVLNETDFYSASEINLSFQFQSETFDGPALTVYKEENKFYFKGKWRSERTLLSLIKELSSLLRIVGLNEELRFLLLESDKNEIHEWLLEQGITLPNIKPIREFAKRRIVLPKHDIVGLTVHDHDLVDATDEEVCNESNEEYDSEDDSEDFESFKPSVFFENFDATHISVKTKVFTNAIVKAENNYQEIQSQEVREDVGRWCEEFVFEYLKSNKNIGTEIFWLNKEGESGKPYDFIIKDNGIEKFIDVKGTPSDNKDIIYLSPNEWTFMFNKGESYAIYRVYNAGNNARIEIIENPSGLLQAGIIFPNPITLQV